MNKRCKYESESENDNKSESSVEPEQIKHLKSIIKSLNKELDAKVVQNELIIREKNQLIKVHEERIQDILIDKDNLVRGFQQNIQILTNKIAKHAENEKVEELEKELKKTSDLVKLLEEKHKQLTEEIQDLNDFSDGALEDIKMLVDLDVESFIDSYEGYLQDLYNYAWTLIQASDFIDANIENYDFIKTQCEEDINKDYSMSEEFYKILKIPGLVLQDECEKDYFHQTFRTIQKDDDVNGKDFAKRFVEWVTKIHEKFFDALAFVQMNISRKHKKLIANYPVEFLNWCVENVNKDTKHGLELFLEKKNPNHVHFISEVAKGFDLKRSAVHVLA
jgi:DNA repair exonuclease SbcCD ATPase subunit